MPLLYETSVQQVLIGKLRRPLTANEVQKLRNVKSLMEQRANIYIHKIEATPAEIRIYFSTKTQKFIIPLMPIAIIISAIALPITAWFLTQPPAPGPLGLPQWFWIGLGFGIPIIGLALLLRRK